MTRVRTYKTSKYFSISNETAQDANISFASLGLLTYCLSMPPDWDFNPKVIWKSRDLSRDKVYKAFNELISNNKCIRIRKPNPNAKNLPGEIEYEIFDDSDQCKKRASELKSEGINFIEDSEYLKKCFRHPEIQDTEGQDPNSQYITKETQIPYEKESVVTNPTTTSKAEADVDVDLIFSDSEKESLKNFSAEQVSQAKKTTKENCKQKANPSRVKYFFKVIQNLPKEKLKEAEKVSYADKMLELQEQAARLAVKGENYQVHTYAQFIILRKKTHGMWSEEKLTVSEDAIKKLKSFVKEHHCKCPNSHTN